MLGSERGRVARWIARYLPLEVLGTIAAVMGAAAAYEATGSLVAAAVAGTVAEGVGYYALVVVRIRRRIQRPACRSPSILPRPARRREFPFAVRRAPCVPQQAGSSDTRRPSAPSIAWREFGRGLTNGNSVFRQIRYGPSADALQRSLAGGSAGNAACGSC
jgi:hypothetical protein